MEKKVGVFNNVKKEEPVQSFVSLPILCKIQNQADG